MPYLFFGSFTNFASYFAELKLQSKKYILNILRTFNSLVTLILLYSIITIL